MPKDILTCGAAVKSALDWQMRLAESMANEGDRANAEAVAEIIRAIYDELQERRSEIVTTTNPNSDRG